MKTTFQTALVAVLALAAVAAGGIAWWQHHERTALTARLAKSDEAGRALEKRLKNAERRTRELETQLAAAREEKTGRRPSASDGDASSPGTLETDGPDRGREGRRPGALFDDPELVALWTSQQKAALDQRYATLFKNLARSGALDAGQLDALKNLLVEKQSALRDAFAAARAHGVTDREQIDRIAREAQSEIERQIRSMLGDAGYGQYQAYEATFPQRRVVDQLEQRLSYSGAPLNDAQSQQLLRILAETGNADDRGNVAVTADTLTRAQGILSPAQLETLTELRKLQEDQQRMREKMRAYRRAPTPTPATPDPAPK